MHTKVPSVAAITSPEDDRVVLSLLPSGPLRVLLGPAARLWSELQAGGDPAAAIEVVISSYPSAPPEARSQLERSLAELEADGYLRDLTHPAEHQ